MSFELTLLSDRGAEIRLGLNGRLDVGETLRFHKACHQILKDLDNRPLQLDLGGLSYVDSSGIGALVVMHNRSKDEGRSLCLVNCSGEVMKVLRLLNLHRMLNIA